MQLAGPCVPTAHSTDARRIIARQDFLGHLWQNRYSSCPHDEPRNWAAIRTVQWNPLRADRAALAEDRPGSSAGAHSRGQLNALGSAEWALPPMEASGLSWLAEPDNRATTRLILANTTKGCPMESGGFRQATGIQIRQAFATATTRAPARTIGGEATIRSRRSYVSVPALSLWLDLCLDRNSRRILKFQHPLVRGPFG